MRRMITAITVCVTVAALGPAVFAVGEGSGGRGYTSSAAGGAGRPSSDGLTSTGSSFGLHPGGMGMGNASASSQNTAGSTDNAYQSTGVSVHLVDGKGPSTGLSASEKGYNIPIVRGIGITSATPGGRGF